MPNDHKYTGARYNPALELGVEEGTWVYIPSPGRVTTCSNILHLFGGRHRSNVSHFNVGPLVLRIVRRRPGRSRSPVLTRSSIESVGIVRKDGWRPDEEEQGDGDDQRKGIQQVKVTLVGGQVAVVPVNELGYSEDAPSEVGDAGEEEDVVEGGPTVEESLAGRGVSGCPDHVTRATTASMASDDRHPLDYKLKSDGIDDGLTIGTQTKRSGK